MKRMRLGLEVGSQIQKDLPSFHDLALSLWFVSLINRRSTYRSTCESSLLMVKSAVIDCNR